MTYFKNLKKGKVYIMVIVISAFLIEKGVDHFFIKELVILYFSKKAFSLSFLPPLSSLFSPLFSLCFSPLSFSTSPSDLSSPLLSSLSPLCSSPFSIPLSCHSPLFSLPPSSLLSLPLSLSSPFSSLSLRFSHLFLSLFSYLLLFLPSA